MKVVKNCIRQRKEMVCVYCHNGIKPGDWYITDGVDRAHLMCDLTGGRKTLRGVGMARTAAGQARPFHEHS